MTNRLVFILILLVSLIFVPLQYNVVEAQKTHYNIYAEPLPKIYDYYSTNPVIQGYQFWEQIRPDLSFSLVSSESEADIIIHWVKEKGEHWAGLAYDRFVLVELGDSRCGNQWNQYGSSYVSNIISHEIGHVLGYEHESQLDSIMNSGGRGDKYYGIMRYEKIIPAGWYWKIPTCASYSGTTLHWSVESSDRVNGFDAYVVPTLQDAINGGEGKPISVYTDGECVGENYVKFGGICSISPGSYILIKSKSSSSYKIE